MYGVAKVSEPTVSDAGNEQVELKDDILLYRDLTVSVKPQNYYVSFFSIGPVVPIVPFPTVGDPPFKRKGQHFLLVVQMETESEGYKFNPAHVVIQYNNNAHKPTAARGPYPGGGHAREVEIAVPGHKWECLPPKGELISGLEPRIVKGKVCFEIDFPFDTLRPEEEFRVTLGGIEKDGNPLRASTLLFRPSFRSGFTLMMGH
jgi:hypothetical protein